MRVVFAGPSLFGADLLMDGIELRPPAAQGDLFDAVADGATVIGLIDGYFGSTAAVWHKEILFALERGVAVIGGASMGALRAAECAAFGMLPIGNIAARYIAGEYDDDGLVAVCHAPSELGFAPTTEALVDVRATVARLRARRAISDADCDRLLNRAEHLFFADRTLAALLDAIEPERRPAVEGAYRQNFLSLKQCDALAVVEAVRHLRPVSRAPSDWKMRTNPTWLDFVRGRSHA